MAGGKLRFGHFFFPLPRREPRDHDAHAVVAEVCGGAAKAAARAAWVRTSLKKRPLTGAMKDGHGPLREFGQPF